MRGLETPRLTLSTYAARVPEPPPPPTIESDQTRNELVRRIRDFADDWQNPRRTAGRDPALAAERGEQAARLHVFASQLVQHHEDLATLEKPEMIVLVLCCARMPADAFARAVMDYARDVACVDADDLDIPAGLLRAFQR